MCGADFMVIPTLYHLVEQVPIGWRALKPHHLSISPNACAYSVRERYRTSIWSSETRSSIFTRILLKHTIYKSQKNAFLKWLKHIKKGLPRNGMRRFGEDLIKSIKNEKISRLLFFKKKFVSFVWKVGGDVLYRCKVSNFVGKLRDL